MGSREAWDSAVFGAFDGRAPGRDGHLARQRHLARQGTRRERHLAGQLAFNRFGRIRQQSGAGFCCSALF